MNLPSRRGKLSAFTNPMLSILSNRAAVVARLVMIAAIACTEGRSAAPPVRTPATPSTPVRARNIAEGTTANLGIGDSDCPTDTATVHDSAGALVREYVSRDAADSLSVGDWTWGALTCVEHATSDFFAVIADVRVDSITQSRDSARFVATYQQAFELGWDSTGSVPHLVPNQRTLVDTFTVLHTRKGWRIDQLDGGAHRSVDGTLRSLSRLSESDRESLRALAKKR